MSTVREIEEREWQAAREAWRREWAERGPCEHEACEEDGWQGEGLVCQVEREEQREREHPFRRFYAPADESSLLGWSHQAHLRNVDGESFGTPG